MTIAIINPAVRQRETQHLSLVVIQSHISKPLAYCSLLSIKNLVLQVKTQPFILRQLGCSNIHYHFMTDLEDAAVTIDKALRH